MNILTKLFACSLLLLTSTLAIADADWLTTDGKTVVMPGVDDGTFQVQMEHSFPYYGGVFTNAWMSSNGVIILYDPTTGTGNPNTRNSMCCSGYDFMNQPINQFSYMIAPAMADFRDPDGSGNAGYYYETNSESTSFLWYNLVEYGTSNQNTFQADLFADGSIQFLYDELNVTRRNVFIGNTGDMSDGTNTEVNQLYYGYGARDYELSFVQENPGYGFEWNSTGSYQSTGPDCSSPLNDPSCPGYDAAYYDQQCSANATYDPNCPGYEQAYYDQQCSADPLYDQNCPGYAEAYYDQQCAADPLSDPYCPGYEQAYYDQQCSADATYDAGCPGYEQAYYDQQCNADPLYDSQCPGYEQAYFDQQCNADPLYDQNCPGYADAYYDQQCSADPLYDSQCPGYEQAYFDQQCSADSLYSQSCPGYEQAYFDQQCSADPLYDSQCPGYDAAYYDQQCSADPLYDSQCPGYDTAFYNQQCSNNPAYDSKCPGNEDINITPNLVDDPDTERTNSFAINIALQQALQHSGAGITIFGVDYGFDYRLGTNSSIGVDVGVSYNNSTEPNMPSSETIDQLYFDKETNGYESFSKRNLSYAGIPMETMTGFGMDFTLQGDAGVKNLNAQMLFTGDMCTENPLYNTSCSGYEEAYLAQQCLIVGPLYDSQCPGYASAYFDQQCGIDTLYDSQCPGYAEAYYDQQCGMDALYDNQCPGYEEAYLAQQCGLDTLYDSQCPGYEEAYFDQQCGLDTLYDSQCPGYEEAYFDQQCGLDPLYDNACPGYEEAYFDQQCGLDTLYDQACPGYAEAYFDQQCGLDPLYDNTCPGYEQAYFDQQCGLDPLYDNQCPGYEQAYYDQQCSLDPLYDNMCPGYDDAYFDQQCSLDDLYDTGCPGYQDAVAELQFNASCTADPLFDTECPGYATAKQMEDLEAQMAEQQQQFTSTANDMGSTSVLEPVTATSSDNTGASSGSDSGTDLDQSMGVVEPAQTAPTPEPVIEEVAIVEEPVAEETAEDDPIELEPEVASVATTETTEKSQSESDTDEKTEADEKKESSTTKAKAKVDVMSIVSDVLAAERELVENNVNATAQTSSASSMQSQSTQTTQGSQTTSSGTSSVASTPNGSAQSTSNSQQTAPSLFDMDITATIELAETQAATLDQSSAFSGGAGAFASGISNDATATTASQNLGDSLAAGGSISQALSNPSAPPGSNITPSQPSPSQQQSTAKAESLADRMSTAELEAIAEKNAKENEDSGEYGDQTLDVVIMNNGTDMNTYYSVQDLQKQNTQMDWYMDKGIYKGNKPRDNLGVFYGTAGKSEKMLREMMRQQLENKDEQ